MISGRYESQGYLVHPPDRETRRLLSREYELLLVAFAGGVREILARVLLQSTLCRILLDGTGFCVAVLAHLPEDTDSTGTRLRLDALTWEEVVSLEQVLVVVA